MNKKQKVISIFLFFIFAFQAVFADYYSKGDVKVKVEYNYSAIRITNSGNGDIHNVKLVLNGKYIYTLGTFYKNDSEIILYSEFSGASSYLVFKSLTVFCDEGSFTVIN